MEDWRKVVLLGVIGVSLMTLSAFGQQWNSAPAPLDVSGQIAEVGERAIHALDQQMTGLAGLLTRRADDFARRIRAAPVSLHARQAVLLCPTPVAVHDDGDMLRQRRAGLGAQM